MPPCREPLTVWIGKIRESIAGVEGGQRADLSLRHPRACPRTLRPPVRARGGPLPALENTSWFEPDGALLRLPINLLVYR